MEALELELEDESEPVCGGELARVEAGAEGRKRTEEVAEGEEAES